MTIILSPMQSGLVNWVKTGKGSAFVESVAGSGKTTSLLFSAAETEGDVAVMAYNKAASLEFETKAKKLGLHFGNRVKFGTVHSFGLRGWRGPYPKVEIDEKKKAERTIAHFRANKYPEELDNFVLKLVSLAKQRMIGLGGNIENEAAWYEIVDHFDLAYDLEEKDNVTVADGVDLAIRTLQYHIGLSKTLINFDDMIYMPAISGVKLTEHDWVFMDEAQDTNPARRALAAKMLRVGGRSLWFGDRHQGIYGFTGADNDAVDLIIKDFNCIQLPLTVSYRCPKAVVEEARKIVTHIEPTETAIEGRVSEIGFADFVKPDNLKTLLPTDAILCRKTKPIVSLAYSLIRHGVACHVEGREIGTGLVKLVDRFKKRAKDIDHLRDLLETFGETESQKLIAKGRETMAEALLDRIETIIAIMEAVPPASSVGELRQRIFSMFVDTTDGMSEENRSTSRKQTLTLSTVHKAKGREWPRVFILGRTDYMPSAWARKPWQMDQEMNLIYVAVTRAQEELTLINGMTA